MTNTIAVGLGLTLIAGLTVDYALNNGQTALFLGRAFVRLVEWTAFWR